jgi:hypothetical protein
MATPPKGGTPSARMAAAFQRLLTSSKELNAASDALAQQIGPVDDAIRSLNVGVRTWVTHTHLDQPDDTFYEEYLSYEKFLGRWGLVIGTRTGAQGGDWDEVTGERWHFNDAPRDLRIGAIDALPELVEKLVVNADKITKQITAKTPAARELAEAVKALAPAKK